MKRITLRLVDTDYTGIIQRLEYMDGGAPALKFVSLKGEPLCTLSVNMPGNLLLGRNTTFIKDWSENEGVLKQLVDQGIVRELGHTVNNGFVTVPMVEIIEPKLQEFGD